MALLRRRSRRIPRCARRGRGAWSAVVVSPTTVVDAARIQRARMLGELCYTIPGSQLPADRKRAERFATQYLGVAA